MSAVAAIFLASKIMSIDPIGGQGLELDAIAAVVIGGASLFGGRALSSARCSACSSWYSSATG